MLAAALVILVVAVSVVFVTLVAACRVAAPQVGEHDADTDELLPG